MPQACHESSFWIGLEGGMGILPRLSSGWELASLCD
jgi:hypothetical protein